MPRQVEGSTIFILTRVLQFENVVLSYTTTIQLTPFRFTNWVCYCINSNSSSAVFHQEKISNFSEKFMQWNNFPILHFCFISLKTVFEHVEVGIFFLVFSLHTHLFQGGKNQIQTKIWLCCGEEERRY